MVGIERGKRNKYNVLRQAKQQGYTIGFDVLFYATNEDGLGKAEAYYIRKHLPPLNYQIPKIENYHSYEINPKAKTITLAEIMGDTEYFSF